MLIIVSLSAEVRIVSLPAEVRIVEWVVSLIETGQHLHCLLLSHPS